jgi:hypothetical protein
MLVDLIQDLNKKGIGNVKGYRDVERKQFRKAMQLDENAQYFFTKILNEEGSFYKYSFDVKDGDRRYEFGKNQEADLRTVLGELRSWIKLGEIFIEYVQKNGGTALEEKIKEICD